MRIEGDVFGLPDWPVRFVPTANKAFLNVYQECVDIDPSLEYLPDYVLLFIKLHELAHLYNNNPPGKRIMKLEMNCDLISAITMIKCFGYTMTEVLGAMEIALGGSPEKNVRMNFVKQNLSQWNQY